jgi:hypothetical protein
MKRDIFWDNIILIDNKKVFMYKKCSKSFIFILFFYVSVIAQGQSKILQGGKIYFYLAEYTDSVNNIINTDTILFITTDIPWKYQPEVQKTVIWEFPNMIKDTLNRMKYQSICWSKFDTTGAIENDKEYWIHPPRNNQFSITEIAPFPSIKLPCELDKSYHNILSTSSGWRAWSNLNFINSYEIIKKDIRKVENVYYDCWIIKADSDSNIGKNYLTLSFNEEVGFVELIYKFYNGTKITLELIKIKK